MPASYNLGQLMIRTGEPEIIAVTVGCELSDMDQ